MYTALMVMHGCYCSRALFCTYVIDTSQRAFFLVQHDFGKSCHSYIYSYCWSRLETDFILGESSHLP